MRIGLIIPQNILPLYLFWFLVDNAGGEAIPYHLFTEISYAYKSQIQLQMAVYRVRPLLEMAGFEVKAKNGEGYLCYKKEAN